MSTLADLSGTLQRIDGCGYRAYRELRGAYRGDGFWLEIEHVQGDPFATPSRLRLHFEREQHGIPQEMWTHPARRTATCDHLLREFARALRGGPRIEGTGHSGRILVDAGGAEILSRSGCTVHADGRLELRFRAGLPARGRSVLGRAAVRLLNEAIPRAAACLPWERLDRDEVRRRADLCEDHAALQERLAERGLVAFVRDGSILPRASGVSSRPLADAVPFTSPDALRISLPTLHHGEVRGMGLPEGVTLVTGGGFHGKTTLLEALQFGIYPHVPGDGREWVVTRADTVKVRSEDGRAVAGVDLRPFIRDLPGERDTARFTTQDASGSTSLAAAMLEAMELGAGALLLDEDTSATNLLIRDARMQALVRHETITPLIDRVREMHRALGVSTVLVVGGSGDYLDVADRVLLLQDYLPQEVTTDARRVAAERPTGRGAAETGEPFRVTPRRALPGSFDPRRGRRNKVKARGLRELLFGEETIDLSALEQLVDDSQARGIGVLLKRIGERAGGSASLRAAVESVLAEARERGLGALDPSPELALPRSFELAGAANRLRSLAVEIAGGEADDGAAAPSPPNRTRGAAAPGPRGAGVER